jgi:hypothetical protein
MGKPRPFQEAIMNNQTRLDLIKKLKKDVAETLELNSKQEVLKPECSSLNLFVILGKVNQEEAKLTAELNELKTKLCPGCYHYGITCGYFKTARVIDRCGEQKLNCWRL